MSILQTFCLEKSRNKAINNQGFNKDINKDINKDKVTNNPNRNNRRIVILIVAVLLLLLFFVLNICFGAVNIGINELLDVLLLKDYDSKAFRIIRYVRFPRTVAAVLAGSALAVSGAITQTVLNNALASPRVIGVNSGAGLFIMICMVAFPNSYSLLPLAAFLGALLTALLVYFIANQTGASRITIILVGTAISSIFTALIDTLNTLNPDAMVNASAFMIGGLAGVSENSINFAKWYILIGIIAAWLLSFDMNILQLGDETAASVGLNIKRVKFMLLTIAALLAGAAVSFVGLIGFVGLIVPHGVRFIIGEDNRFLIPACAVFGAGFVLICDLGARLLFAPFELPLGILMSFLGGPIFLYLVLKKRGRLSC